MSNSLWHHTHSDRFIEFRLSKTGVDLAQHLSVVQVAVKVFLWIRAIRQVSANRHAVTKRESFDDGLARDEQHCHQEGYGGDQPIEGCSFILHCRVLVN